MRLLRQLEWESFKEWDSKRPLPPEMVNDHDCEVTLLNGWADKNLSVWDVSGDGRKPGRQRILAGLCKRRTDWKKVGWVEFAREAVEDAGLTLEQKNGRTGDSAIDTAMVHFEVSGLSGKALSVLISRIHAVGYDTGVYTKAELDEWLWKAAQEQEKLSRPWGGSGIDAATVMPPSGTEYVKHSGEDDKEETEGGTVVEIPPSGTSGSVSRSDNATSPR